MAGELELKASGEAAYVADSVPRPCLFGAVLTVPVAHADVSVDVALLRSVDGVVAVLGQADGPPTLFSSNVHGGAQDTQVFTSRSRFAGDVVGAVAAESRRGLKEVLAVAAAGGISWTELPAVLDLGTAETGERIANDRYPGNRILDEFVGIPDTEAERLLAEAPLRHRSRVEISPAPHGFLEPVACGAQWLDDRVRVWSCSQGPQVVRDRLAALVGHTADVITPFIGGGFGGKEEFFLEPIAALLSRAADGKPVLVELDREQCTRRFRMRHGGYITVETGFTHDGALLVRRAHVVLEAGPYDGHSANVTSNAAGAFLRLYPSVPTSVHAVTLATNRVPGGAFRAYGSELASFAMETHLDEVAGILGHDPIAMRIENCARHDDIDPVTGGRLAHPRARAGLECLRELADAWDTDAAHTSGDGHQNSLRFRRGAGVALMVGTAPAGTQAEPSICEVRAEFDGSSQILTLTTGVPELGQGIFDLLLRVAVSETDIEPERIEVRCTSEIDGPADPGMFGNRGAPLTAAAAVDAITGLKQLIAESHHNGTDCDETVEIVPGWRRIRVGQTEIPLSDGRWTRDGIGMTTDAQAGVAFGAALAEVEVDTATGLVDVLRAHAVHDVGRLLNRRGAVGQAEGGLVQAIGMALSERAAFDAAGTADVKGFYTHLVPTMKVAPRLGVTWLEDSDGESAGPKGLGENTVAALPPAIANAVRAATGAEVRALPLSPNLVLDAIDAARVQTPATSTQSIGSRVL